MESESTIQIALPSDQNYFHGLMVTATSIALYAKPGTSLHFHILDGGIGDDSYALLEQHLCGMRRNVSLSRHHIDTGQFAGCPAWSRNRMTYARLLLPTLMPEANWVIYSDTDVLWLAAADLLWEQIDNQTPAWVTRDGCAMTRNKENAWYKEKGLPCPGEDYFCAGVILFNLKKFREERLAEQAFAFIEKYPDLNFADQTALNHLLLGRVELIAEQWQTLTINLKVKALDDPVVLHYANEIPWKRTTRWGLLSDAVMIWHRFNDKFVLKQKGASLKRWYPRVERLTKRGLYSMLLLQVPRSIFFWLLRRLNREDVIANVTPYLHPLGRSQLMALSRTWDQHAMCLAEECHTP